MALHMCSGFMNILIRFNVIMRDRDGT